MNGKRNATLAVVGIFILVGVLLSVLVRLWLAVDEGRAEARASFQELLPELGAQGSMIDLSSRERRLALVNSYSVDPRLLVVWVTDRDRGVLWRLPDRSPYLPASENFSHAPRVKTPGLSTVLLRADWSGGGRRAEVEALYVVLSQDSVFAIFRDSTIVLGAWVLFALFVILLGGGEGERVSWRPGTRQRQFEENPKARDGGPEGNADLSPETADRLEEELFESTDSGEDAGSPPGEVEAGTGSEDFEIPELDLGEPTAKELYSPASSLGYSSWLEERLGSELSRAAAIEQDLSLLVMSLDGISQGDEEYPLVAQSLREFFSFRDLAFERDENGFSVILPNLDVAHALRMAEEFHKKLTIQIRGREGGGQQAALPLYMGLSSRAGRLVEARRLIDEAGLALERAREEDDSKIVAFKPDPDKYRLWLASMGNY